MGDYFQKMFVMIQNAKYHHLKTRF